MEHELEVEGMSCGHCVSSVKDILGEIEGVLSVNVSLEDKKAVISSSENVTREMLINHLNETKVYQAK